MSVIERYPIEVDMEASTLAVPHWGITLRTLYGAALQAWPDAQPGERRDFTVLHKETPIAVLHVQQHDDI